MSQRPDFQPEPPPDAFRNDAAGHPDVPTPTPTSPDQAALSRILRESVDRATEMDVIALASVEPLLRVAREHRGQPFDCEPIAVALLEAALVSFFDPAGVSVRDGWRKIAAQVARSLCDDPITGPRLEQLWQKLGVAAHEAPT